LDFLAFDNVQRFLDEQGVKSDEDMWEYIPKRIEFDIDDRLVHGDIGTQASSGYVAFNLAYNSKKTYTSSLFVIVGLDGKLKKVYNTIRPSVGKDQHFCALKLLDPDTFILGGDVNTTNSGEKYLLKWKNGTFHALMDGMASNPHDAQFSFDGTGIWQPMASQTGIELRDAQTGSLRKSISLAPAAMDINHVQLINEDSEAIVSSRLTGAIIKVDVDKEEMLWVGGGHWGGLEMQSATGEILNNGSSLFKGQYNAEYFGKNEYFIFDNQYDSDFSMEGKAKKPSRALIVSIEENQNSMKELWEYSFHSWPHGYCPEFGDADRLPTGNILTNFWPYVQSGRDYKDITYDVRASEIDRTTKELAWDMKVYGNNECTEENCIEQDGWRMYSVERFYENPLVHHVVCDVDAEMIYFTVHNNFKQNNEYIGTYKLTETNEYQSPHHTMGHFNFSAHWRPTYVSVPISGNAAKTDMKLVVTNQWGQKQVTHVDC